MDEVVGAVRDAERDLADSPGVAADLFGDAAEATGSDRTAAVEMAVGRARALARSGQMGRAEEVARTGLAAATDPIAAAELRRVLIFAASSRGDVTAALAMVDETLREPAVPDRVRQVLGDHRRYLSILGGTGPVPLEPFAADPRQLTLTGLVAEALRCFLVGRPQLAIEYAAEASRLHMSAGLDPFEGRSGRRVAAVRGDARRRAPGRGGDAPGGRGPARSPSGRVAGGTAPADRRLDRRGDRTARRRRRTVRRRARAGGVASSSDGRRWRTATGCCSRCSAGASPGRRSGCARGGWPTGCTSSGCRCCCGSRSA